MVEQTGYPAEVVDLDADLEADLGIDSIKKAQLFGELQEYFDVSALAGSARRRERLSLDDFTTLRHVLDFLCCGADSAAAAAAAAPAQLADAGRANTRRAQRLADQRQSMPSRLRPRTSAQPVVLRRNALRPRLATRPASSRPKSAGFLRHYADCVGESLDELPGQARESPRSELLSADELDELQGLADAVEVPLGNCWPISWP